MRSVAEGSVLSDSSSSLPKTEVLPRRRRFISVGIRNRRHLRLRHLGGDVYVHGECNSFLCLVMMMLVMMMMLIVLVIQVIIIIIQIAKFGHCGSGSGLGSSGGTAANNRLATNRLNVFGRVRFLILTTIRITLIILAVGFLGLKLKLLLHF
jgi:hypothetical protein